MTTQKQARIEITEMKDRAQYITFCRNRAPIFFPGDPIKTRLVIDYLEDNQPLKYKSISASIIGRIYKDKLPVCEFTVATFKIKDQNSLFGGGAFETPNSGFDFTFNGLQFQSPSYYGCKFQLAYYIQYTIVLRSWKQDIVTERHIILLEPESNVVSRAPVSQFIENEGVSFNVYFNKEIYAINDTINGQIAFADTTKSTLARITMNVIISETYNGKTEETLLIDYEVMDGCPRSGTTVPFNIQLHPYRLSYLREGRNSLISTQFIIEVNVRCKNNTSFSTRQPFTLYIPSL